jgi:hypothetical protein
MKIEDTVEAVLQIVVVLILGLGAIAATAGLLYGFAALWVLLVCR